MDEKEAAGKHTPGPWRIVRSSDYTGDESDTTIQSIDGADGKTVYYTESGYFKPLEADARLIAAAPELLEACMLADQAEGTAEDSGDYEKKMGIALRHIRAAIAKATNTRT